MTRTHALIAAIFLSLMLMAVPASAQVPESPPGDVADSTQEQEAWRGDVPISGVIGATAAVLGVLTVVAVRREWVI